MKKIIYENKWQYLGEDVESELLKDFFGFVYKITDTLTNKFYIGKKFIWSRRKVKGKTRRQKLESDWKQYYSSHAGLKQIGKIEPARLKREILHLCLGEGETNFKETMEIIKRDALWRDDYLNDNLLGRYFRNNVKNYFNKEDNDENI